MSGIVTTGEKRLVLASGRAHPVLAQEVADELGVEILPMDAWDFANGEIYVRYGESVRGTDVFVLQSHPAPINTWVMEHLIMIDALKRASAKRITAVAPSFPYARQDKKHRGREPISARLMADLYRDLRRGPHDLRRPPCSAGAGLLQPPARPPDGVADPRGVHPGQVRR